MVVTETLIRERVEDLAKAIGAKDVDHVMALYARDLVSFDLTPPLRLRADEKRRAWQAVFATSSGPITYEVRDLTVTTNGEVAFVHSLNHINSTLPNGPVDMWLRWTACFLYVDAHMDFYQPEANTNGEAASSDLALATGRGPRIVT